MATEEVITGTLKVILATTTVILTTEEVITTSLKVISAVTKVILVTGEVITATDFLIFNLQKDQFNFVGMPEIKRYLNRFKSNLGH